MAKAQVRVAGTAPRSASDRLTALRARPRDRGGSERGDPGRREVRAVYLGSDRWSQTGPRPGTGPRPETGPRPATARPTAPFGAVSVGEADPDGVVFEDAPFGAARFGDAPLAAAPFEDVPGDVAPPGRSKAVRRPGAGPPLSGAEITAPLPVIGGASGVLSRLAERWLPAGWRSARLDPGRPGATAVVVVAAVAAMVAAIGVWRDRPVAEAPPALTSAAAADPGRGDPGASSRPPARAEAGGAPLVVSVAGKVRRPGLVRLPDGSRVADAITEAGGPLSGADLMPLNLARRVVDGEQILVGVPIPPGGSAPPGAEPTAGAAAGGATGGSGGGAAAGRIDLNRATLEQLDTLPGVGPVTAQRILAWRAAHGRFGSVDQLREIEGIGERRFTQLRDQVTV